MGDAKRRREKIKAIDLPIADEASITTTTIYPTIEAMWLECIQSWPWFWKYSIETQRTLKFAFYTGIAESLRTIAFRLNADQSETVFSDFDLELRAYDKELQRLAETYSAALQ
jgi:hypothetical protein